MLARNPARSLLSTWILVQASAVGLLALLPPGDIRAEGTPLPHVSSVGPTSDSDWMAALRLERAEQYRDAGLAYEAILDRDPTRHDAAWRAARAYWQSTEATDGEPHEAKEPWLVRADSVAGRGLEANRRCGECALWKYAAMGRLTEHRSTVWATRHARDMRDLLELGIKSKPTHRDPDGNSALGNLYYSSAIFYRMVPDWFWLPLIAGVRGDTDRALADIRRALAISVDRIDYQIEHGAVLLCHAIRHGDQRSASNGRRVLEQAIALPPKLPSDEIDQHYARLLLEDSSGACGFTRGGFLDVEEMGRSAGVGR